MTNPPPQASSSTSGNPYTAHIDSQRPLYYGSNILPYGNYASWNNLWTTTYAPYGYTIPHKLAPPPNVENTSPSVTTATSTRVNTPPPPNPDTYRHWDQVLKTFLDKAKLTQSRRGFELDILVLNSDWEQRTLPEAIKGLVHGMQVILNRMEGREEDDAEKNLADANLTPTSQPKRPLEERKLDYIKLRDGTTPEPRSSVAKTISQFLARSRARNDLSNRAEFLQSLAEKKQSSSSAEESDSTTTIALGTEMQQPVSCARVDAKTIDRAKQIKYDIMKNEDGPLTRTSKPAVSNSLATPQNLPESSTIPSSSSNTAVYRSMASDTNPQLPRKRRRLTDVTELPKSKATGDTSLLPQETDGDVSAALVPAIDERMRNMEDHLSVRYVPSPPKTFHTRLKYLEDHIIRLEKDYPPWAALHFKQPDRGWPPPPRSTPIIIPPHLRSTGHSSSNSVRQPQPGTSTTLEVPVGHHQPSANAQQVKAKPRNNSTLHKAVMDRLEIQRAMNEMGLQ